MPWGAYLISAQPRTVGGLNPCGAGFHRTYGDGILSLFPVTIPTRAIKIVTAIPTNNGSTAVPSQLAANTLKGPADTQAKAHLRPIDLGKKSAQVNGTKTTAPLSPIDKKPRSLIVAEGTMHAMAADTVSIAKIIPLVAIREDFAESKR